MYIALRLLRDGAHTTITTRFPNDAVRRFAAMEDSADWLHRLRVVGIDLRDPAQVVALADVVAAQGPLDILINNAAQTVRRPPGCASSTPVGTRNSGSWRPRSPGYPPNRQRCNVFHRSGSMSPHRLKRPGRVRPRFAPGRVRPACRCRTAGGCDPTSGRSGATPTQTPPCGSRGVGCRLCFGSAVGVGGSCAVEHSYSRADRPTIREAMWQAGHCTPSRCCAPSG